MRYAGRCHVGRKAWEQNGIWKCSRRAGSKARRLKGALAAGFPTEPWTIKRVRALVRREFGVAYSHTGGWELLRSLGFSPPKPEKRELQRDEQAIAEWRRKTWPALKKTSAREEPSSS